MRERDPTNQPLRDRWPPVVFGLHLVHTLWFARLYPHSASDPDLVAYFVYFENWLGGVTGLHGIDYFPVAKPLLVALLGPLGHVEAAFLLTAVVSGTFGMLVYLVCRQAFGRATGVTTALVLLLDVDRAMLTLRSSADLYMGMLLFASIWATTSRRYALSGLAIALAVLIKPVALPCALHLLAVDGPDRRRALRAMLLPLAAIPLVVLSNVALLGSAAGPARFFAAFEAHHQGAPMTADALLHFVAWVQMKQVIFPSTATFGVLGLVWWIGRDRARLASPMLMVPLLLLGGYVAMSLVVPFVPISRFFWVLQVWLMGFVVAAILETARRMASSGRGLQLAMSGLLVLFLADGLLSRQLDYRRRAMQPLEDAMAFLADAVPVLAAERMPGETVLTSIAFLPSLVWALDDVREHPERVRTTVDDPTAPSPDWVLYAGAVAPNRETRAAFERLLATGNYEARFVAGPAALFVRRDRHGPIAWRSAPGG